MIDLDAVVPERFHRFCRWIIDHQELKFNDRSPGLDITMSMRAEAKIGTEEANHIKYMTAWLEANKRISSTTGQGLAFDLLIDRCLGMSLKIGPKVFNPGPDLCSSLEQLDISIPPAEFLMPFQVFFVGVPKGVGNPNRPRRGKAKSRGSGWPESFGRVASSRNNHLPRRTSRRKRRHHHQLSGAGDIPAGVRRLARHRAREAVGVPDPAPVRGPIR